MCVVCHPFPVVDIVRPSYVRVACVSEVGKEEEEEEGRRRMSRRKRRRRKRRRRRRRRMTMAVMVN